MSSPSDPRLDELRERVEEQEAELHVAVEELQDVARRAVDVRYWVRSRPVVWIAGAFLLGAWLGGRQS